MALQIPTALCSKEPEAMRFPSGDHVIGPAALMVKDCSLLSTFRTSTMPSLETEAMCFPSGDHTIEPEELKANDCSSPGFQISTAPSLEVEAMRLPSGDHAIDLTKS